MSHVDEGTLHAYLDGELPSAERAALERHLATCATCRDLLTEERALLERASALLGSARPVEHPAPPFEQVRRKPTRAPWRVRTSFAWAASVVVALGLGYLIRGSGDRFVPSELGEQRAAVEVAQAPAPANEAPQEPGRQQQAGRRVNAPPAPSLARAAESTSVGA
jgi:predicted anti-sigma-YlaC factor YlaD